MVENSTAKICTDPMPEYSLATAQSQNWSLYYYEFLGLKRVDVMNMNSLLYNMSIEGEDRE